ncbi:DMT family transporter [Pseudoxanthobacter sp. M-2]|uniref:DMT family transporter n=1 Tax=Pseudoxanthobacter sp. M-2 TaxID=3078754 RepID=UPI0038FC07B0
MKPPRSDGLRQLLGLGLGFVGVVMFGGTLPMTSLALQAFDPWFIALGRAAIAAVPAALLLLLFRRPFPPRVARGSLAIAAAGTVIGFPAFSAFALQTVPAAHGAIVLGLLPLATAIAAVVINGERPRRAFWAWSTLGAVLVIAMAVRDAETVPGWGDVFFVLAGASAAIGYAHYARIAPWVSGWESISWALVLTTPLTVTVCAIIWRPEYLDAPVPAVLGLLYTALFSVFIGFFFWNAGMAIGGVARVAQVQLMQTFVTIALAALILGETVGPVTWAFAFAVAFVVLMARRSAGPAR